MAERRRSRRDARGVALVGAGHWGTRLARNLAGVPGWSLRRVCDLDLARAEAASVPSGASATDALGDVLDDPRVEAVVVATPAATHAGLAETCLAADRHLLVEKPLALSVATAEALADLARARGLVLMCDHTYRFAPAVGAIRELLADGAIGALVGVESVRTNLRHAQPDVDVLWDLAHHDVAILAAVLPPDGPPVAVRAERADVLGIGRAHAGRLTVHLGDGITADVRVDWWAPQKVRTVRLTGTHGVLEWDDLDPTGPRLTLRRPDGGARRVPLPDREPLADVVREFLDAVAAGRAPVSGADDELAVLRVLEAATCSAASGGEPVPLLAAPDPFEVTT